MQRMNRTRVILFSSVVAAALVVGGAIGAFSASATPLAALAAASPSPTFKSNESATHEAGESAAQEAAENNGTFHPGGAGGPGGNGQSNESASHEATESPSREASEKS
jgi:hypothetical protein